MIDHDHKKLHQTVTEIIASHRKGIGIDPRWRINVEISCDTIRGGMISWIPDTYEATVTVCCDLPPDLLLWETIHELAELSKYRSGTIIEQFARIAREYGLSDTVNLFMSQYRMARNQEIEEEVGRYLQEFRPEEVSHDG